MFFRAPVLSAVSLIFLTGRKRGERLKNLPSRGSCSEDIGVEGPFSVSRCESATQISCTRQVARMRRSWVRLCFAVVFDQKFPLLYTSSVHVDARGSLTVGVMLRRDPSAAARTACSAGVYRPQSLARYFPNALAQGRPPCLPLSYLTVSS